MSSAGVAGLSSRLAERKSLIAGFLLDEHGALTAAAQDLARRFALGGTLLVQGHGSASTDGERVRDDIAHPAAVHLPTLPVLDIGGPGNIAQVGLARAGDAILALSHGDGAALVGSLTVAGRRGVLRILMTGAPPHPALVAEHRLVVPADETAIVQEAQQAACHLLAGLVQALVARAAPNELDDLQANLRARIASEHESVDLSRLEDCGTAMRLQFEDGGRLFVLADPRAITTARDLMADCSDLGWPAAVLSHPTPGGGDATARQLTAVVRPADTVLALVSNGSSRQLFRALHASSRRGALTCALGSDEFGTPGDRPWLDHEIVAGNATPLTHSEAPSTVCHLLLEVVGRRP